MLISEARKVKLDSISVNTRKPTLAKGWVQWSDYREGTKTIFY
jgi:hypothetical protein